MSEVTFVSTENEVTFVQVGVQGLAGPSAHGELSGLAADDHPQYHNDARGDARYAPLSHASNTSNPHSTTAAQVGADASGTAASAVSSHASGIGVHGITAVTGLQAALDGKSGTSHDHAAVYAPLAKGVTNGDSHDHDGGDGAQIAYSSLSGRPTLGTAAALNTGTAASQIVQLDGAAKLPAVDGSQLTNLPAGVTSHAALTGLAADDHTQYHNNARGDARYSVLAHNHTGVYEASGAVGTHAALTTVHGISSFGATLVDDTSASAARTTLGLGGSATLAVGTTAGTVAAGDDARIVASTAAETTTTIGALINSATAKATPVDADQIGLMDSAASNILKKLSWAALKTTLQSIFATLAGTAGGQTIKGGTAASETLTLQSTAHATKGKLLFGTSAYDEVNNRLGIGQTTPTAALHLKAGTATASTAPIKLTSGTLLTVPEAGAIEYLSGAYYFSNAAATPLRRRLTSEEYIVSRGLSLITNGTGSLLDNTNFSSYTYDPIETYAGAGSFRINVSSGGRLSDDYIPVEVGKRYILSLYAKSGDIGGGNYNAANKQYFGVALYDIDKNNIDALNSGKVSGAADTTLAVALNPGDTTITLTSATGWYSAEAPVSRNFAWYGYTNSYGYTYPDYTYTRFNSLTYSSNSTLGAWSSGAISGNVITLRVPWAGPALSVGAAVRNITSGGTFKYIVVANTTIPNTWTKYSGYIGPGLPEDSVENINLFRHGTAFVRLLHLVNYHGAADNNVRLSAIEFGQISAANLEPQIGIGATYSVSLQSALPANGLAVEGKAGFGTLTPSAQAHSISTTEQLRIGYDAANRASFTVSSAGVLTVATAGTAPAMLLSGDVRLDKTITASGTTGAQTINKSSGAVNFAAGTTSLVVTNNLVSTSSVIVATVATNDTTLKSVVAVAASGSFTLYANAAATAETRVNFHIFN